MPKGISSTEASAIGMTSTDTTGIAARLENKPIGATRWKCQAEKMAVAVPATRLVKSMPPR